MCVFSKNVSLIKNDKVKLPHDNDGVGIIICRNKKRTIVEYALKTSTQPIGVATYSTTSKLPANYRDLLPNAETISEMINRFFQ